MSMRKMAGLIRRLFGPNQKMPHANAEDLSSAAPRERFFAAARLLDASANVLEVGTKQAMVGVPTHLQSVFPNVLRNNYIMGDVLPGADVDVVADLHSLPIDWEGRFNAFVANAVFEHLERPWLAAKEVFRVLAPGGFCYVATHQTFPLHGHPSDFFRFSKEALSLLFTDAGMTVLDVAYEHRALIVPPVSIVPTRAVKSWNAIWPSYICVHLFAEKAAGPR